MKWVCTAKVYLDSIMDGYGGKMDCVNFIDRIATKTAVTGRKELSMPFLSVDTVCKAYPDSKDLRAAIDAIVDIDLITHGMTEENECVATLAQVLSNSPGGVFVVTDDKVLLQKIGELNSPLVQGITVQKAATLLL